MQHLLCWNISHRLEQKEIGFCEVILISTEVISISDFECLLFQVKHFPLPVVREQIRQEYQSS